jgi:hypothetical protein
VLRKGGSERSESPSFLRSVTVGAGVSWNLLMLGIDSRSWFIWDFPIGRYWCETPGFVAGLEVRHPPCNGLVTHRCRTAFFIWLDNERKLISRLPSPSRGATMTRFHKLSAEQVNEREERLRRFNPLIVVSRFCVIHCCSSWRLEGISPGGIRAT